MFKKIAYITVGLTVSVILAAVALVWWLVAFQPGAAIRSENIEKILAVESPVYYSDGRHKIGVFFEQAHRQYTPYAEIPKDFVNAIVAAEDNDFFKHHGIDFQGIFRALMANIRAGRVVQGGSTITQQTAKNLFKRKDRSVFSKLKELLYALRLEYHYPKEKILEFYANQFYVSGNGRGLGVAARYYFDKAVEDLDVLECAFIAGSVKRPNYYNPFIKSGEEAEQKAKEHAKSRVKYVLTQMYRLGMIDVKTYQQNIEKDIPFQQGQMYFSLNTIMDLVKVGLADPEVEEALSQHGIDNVATSGIRVITTVERDLQEKAFYAVRKELSRLDIRLSGYERDALQKKYAELRVGGSSELRPGGFLLARIVAVDRSAEPFVDVVLGKNNKQEGPKGRIDKQGLINALTPLVKFEKQRWTEATDSDLPKILNKLKDGDLVYVSIRDVDSVSGQYHLDLEKYPELQGAVLALKDGTIRAMVGGADNRYYNRAVMAKRPMGSVIKPLVYCAALQLGWNSMDVLNNQRNVFVYQNQPYFPRPDHNSPYNWVSMNWAGVHSENLASVWLLYHLCDHLAPAHFQEIVEHLGLGQQPGESYYQYQQRIRDKLGVVVDQEALYRAAFEKAVDIVEPDLLFAGRFGENEALQTFHFGGNFDRFLEDVEQQQEEEPEQLEEQKQKKEELAIRQALLKRNFIRYRQLREELTQLTKEILLPYGEQQSPDGVLPTDLYYNQMTGKFVYGEPPEGEVWQEVNRPKLRMLLYSLDGNQQLQEFWDSVYIDGVLSVSTVDMLNAAIEKEYKRLTVMPAYSQDVLFAIRDFKVMVALRYLTGLCRAIGIESPLDPVLSFPLGSNVISILEVARAYEGLCTGNTITCNQNETDEGIAIIDRIENSDGETIYVPDRTIKRAVSPQVSLAVSDILRNVVKFGTGRYADANVKLHSSDPEKEHQLQVLDLRMPVMGKTGTANRFTNAAFAGMVPGLARDNTLSVTEGYAVASYVGYDNNEPMVKTTTHITGSTGALPLWSRLANAIFLERDYAKSMDLADLSFAGVSEVPLRQYNLGQITLEVDANSGGTAKNKPVQFVGPVPGDTATITTFGQITPDGEVVPSRYFQPYWQFMEKPL